MNRGTENGQELSFQQATIEDLDLIVSIEARCFPEAEAATRDQFADRLSVYGEHFWILKRGNCAVGFIDGMVTDKETITDDMFENASLHNPTGNWQAIFGLNVLPEYRCQGYAAKLIQKLVDEARKAGRRGCTLTCKEALLHYYARFGFVNQGVSSSVHGGAKWYDMRLVF